MDYPAKFKRISEQTNFRLLDDETRLFLEAEAGRHRFTMQELRIISDMALDRSRWKEPPIQQHWPATSDKAPLMAALRESHRHLLEKAKSYSDFGIGDKPKTDKPVLQVEAKPRLGLGRCPVASERTRCCNLMTLDAVEKCGFDCYYCSIQSF